MPSFSKMGQRSKKQVFMDRIGYVFSTPFTLLYVGNVKHKYPSGNEWQQWYDLTEMRLLKVN